MAELLIFAQHLLISLGFFLGLAVTYWGWGQFWLRRLGIKLASGEIDFWAIWTGWAISLGYFSLVNFWLPITAAVSASYFVSGGLLAIGYARRLPWKSLPFWMVKHRWECLLSILFAMWIASAGMGVPKVYDTGLYHLSSIGWLNQYATVPGLGNLHGRLAFNQALFPYVAALNFFPYFNQGHHIANAFLVGLMLLEALFQVNHARTHPEKGGIFPLQSRGFILLLLPLVYITVASAISSPTPDITAALLQLLLFFQFLRFLRCAQQRQLAAEPRMAFILLLTATAITVKLSNLIFAFTLAACTVLIFLLISRPVYQTALKRIFSYSLLPVVLVGIWGIRGIVLSGYPLYPSSLGGLPVDWAIPRQSAEAMTHIIANWAKQPGVPMAEPMTDWQWVWPWFVRVQLEIAPIYLALIMLGLLGWRGWTQKRTPPKQWIGWLLLPFVPLGVGVICWFLMAPDPRFAHLQFWLLVVAAGMLLSESARFSPAAPPWEDGGFRKAESPVPTDGSWPRLRRVLSGHFKMTAIGLLVLVLGLSLLRTANDHFKTRYSDQPVRSSTLGYEPLPVVPLQAKVTQSGLTVFMPAVDDQCWRASLLCTPDFNPNLQLRKTDLQSGFKVINDQP